MSGRLKKPKMDMGAATEGKSQNQSIKGEVNPKKGKKANTKTCSDVVKGLENEDELETTNSDRNGNKSETADSFGMFDSETLNQLEAERKEGQRKRR